MSDTFKPDILKGRHAFLTGAGSGINFVIAQRYAALGASVTIVGRNLEKAQAAAQTIKVSGGKAQAFSADVRDYDAVDIAMSSAVAEFGPLDIVIAGAAGNFVARAADMSAKGFRTVIEIDLIGSYNTFRAGYTHLNDNGGDMLAISAIQSTVPLRHRPMSVPQRRVSTCLCAALRWNGHPKASAAMQLHLGPSQIPKVWTAWHQAAMQGGSVF